MSIMISLKDSVSGVKWYIYACAANVFPLYFNFNTNICTRAHDLI